MVNAERRRNVRKSFFMVYLFLLLMDDCSKDTIIVWKKKRVV